MSNYDALLTAATQLPVAERLQLIDALWNTVPEDALPPISEERLAEIQRRSAEFHAGRVKTISWQQVRVKS